MRDFELLDHLRTAQVFVLSEEHTAARADARRHDVDVLAIVVVVQHDDALVIRRKAHALHVIVSDQSPSVRRQFFAGGQPQTVVPDGLFDVGS
jgi:hypothetical protein